MKITSVKAQEILDSRGFPTVFTTVTLDSGHTGSAAVPSGASTGVHEALELRDADPTRFLGKGTLTAVANVNDKITPVVLGKDPQDQTHLDQAMLDLDGTETKNNLGANAILSVSMAATRAVASAQNIPLYQYIATLFNNPTDSFTLPIPMMNLLNGGKHASGSSDFQEYMVMPIGAPSVVEAIRFGAETFHNLGKLLKEKGFQTTVGDEGGYAPALGNNEEPLKMLVAAMEKAGYVPGKDIAIALDPAASETYENNLYHLKSEGADLVSDQMIEKFADWIQKYPIVSIEDGLAEDDWQGWTNLTAKLGQKIQIVGDDLYVTNPKRLQQGIDQKASNSILIKLNQIGSVTETINAIKLAKQNGITSVVSHRSGETEDSYIADFVVGAGTGQIKTGSLSRSERIAKYNRLMIIERELGDRATFSKFPF